MRKCGLLFAAAVGFLPSAAPAGDFVDTRVTFVFTNDNVLVGPGETNPSNPGTRFGNASTANTFFYDNYETKYTGFETLSHLVLYKKLPSYFPRLTTEASLALTVQLLSETGSSFGDSGSYIRLTYALDENRPEKWNVQFTAFPFSSDRFRLGYSYQISWGGSAIFPKQDPDINRKNPVPGVKLQANLGDFYAFAGAKTSLLQRKRSMEDPTELEAFWGFLGGAGWDSGFYRAELNGGWFRKGLNPNTSVIGEPVDAFGGSVQFGLHDGLPIGQSIDFRLYRNDPNIVDTWFAPERYVPGKLSWAVTTEYSNLYQALEDAERPGSTTLQRAQAADVNMKVKWDYARFNLDFVFRDLPFVLFNVPSLFPYQTIPGTIDLSPEFFAAAGADYHFPSLHLTPGVSGGVQFPASFTPAGEGTYIERMDGDREIRYRLPPGSDAVPVYAMKATARLDLSDMLSLLAEFRFSIDNNMTAYVNDEAGINVLTFTEPYLFGVNVVMQGRF